MIPFPDKKYSVIYCDPPWQYEGSECLAKKSLLDGNDNFHYNTIPLEELKGLRVWDISEDNCLLFMWVVSPLLPDALEVMSAWGFKFSTVGFVWYKQKVNPGHYTLSECELCLIGKKGNIPELRGAQNVRQFLSKEKGKHSKKPSEIRYRIEMMFPNHTRIELFSRNRVEGWDCWGDQVPADQQATIKRWGFEEASGGWV
jgi:N6-adenosine-specific RNA methylase IME4